jgi:hypothetical protein
VLGGRQGVRAGDEQPCTPERRGDLRVLLGRVGQAPVHRGDAEEHGRVLAQRGCDRVGGEPSDIASAPAAPQRTEDAEDQSVDVEEGQGAGHDIPGGPRPRVG